MSKLRTGVTVTGEKILMREKDSEGQMQEKDSEYYMRLVQD